MHRFQSCWRFVRILMTFTAGLWILSTAAFAQTNSGNIFGTVRDTSGSVLPGVTVTTSGVGAPQTFLTDSRGQFRFLQLAPGSYMVRAELEGFSKVQRRADVTVGNNTEIDLRLSPSVSETMTVTAASPVIDRRQVSDGATIEQIELLKVPTARDPWVVLQSVPGVMVDRVNVGGNKSAQQSYFVGKGIERNQSVWNINGVQTEDMSGSRGNAGAGFYVDFDSFQEFGIVTGSTDPSVRTPGVQINLVTKRGTNDLRGSGRYLYTSKSLQADPSLPSEAAIYGLQSVNSINRITESGIEAGGPLLRDRLWLWGAYSENPINVAVSSFSPQTQKTVLKNWNGKVDAQLLPNNAAFLSYTYNNKTVDHRNIGPTRPVETSYQQTGPGWVWAAEDTHTLTSTFYLTARISSITNGYRLDPVGGDAQVVYDKNSIPHGSYKFYMLNIPQKSATVDGAKFFNFGSASHNLKFGFGYRKTPVNSSSGWPGGGIVIRNDYGEVEITRNAEPNFGSNYGDLFIGDTMVTGNFTATAGLRYDRQRARNNPTTVAANPVMPDLLPGGSFSGDTRSLQWSSVVPRLGLTYALGADRRSVLKASYSRYVDQLGAGAVGPNNPFYRIGVLWYYWDDLNGNGKFEKNELGDFDLAQNVDPNNLSAGAQSTARIDYGMKPPRTDEFVLGTEREIMPSFAVGANLTYRNRKNVLWEIYEKHRGQGDFYTVADYVAGSPATLTGTTPDGNAYTLINYRLKPGTPAPVYTVVTNRPDYHETYRGLEITATKRMRDRWMLRGNVTLSDWKQHVGVNGVTNGDPTRLLSGNGCSTCTGASTLASSGGSDGYINSRWSAALNSVVELPYKMSLSTAVVAREGYIIPYWRRQNNRDGFGNKSLLADNFDSYRLDNLYQIDLRFAKEFSLIAGTGLTLSADLFNVTNQRTVLWRDYRLYSADGTDLKSGTNQIQEMQSPRIWRFGARVTF